MSDKQDSVAILIDGDNVEIELIPRLFDKVRKDGNPIIKEVFFNKHSLNKWDTSINQFSLKSHYVPNNIKGKNSADIALVIRAMELFYKRKDLTKYYIVSSDSDFTGLAKHFVAQGTPVFGIGNHKTAESFRNACTGFIYIEDLLNPEIPIDKLENALNQTEETLSIPAQLFEKLFVQGYEVSPRNTEGWVQLIDLKEAMTNLDNVFMSNGYRYTRPFAEKIEELSKEYHTDLLEIRVDEQEDSNQVLHYINIADCDVFKFVVTLKQAHVIERDRWVLLSIIGTALQEYPAYKNGFTYRGIRNKRPSKVVEEMIKDYGHIIEMRKEHDVNSITHYVRMST